MIACAVTMATCGAMPYASAEGLYGAFNVVSPQNSGAGAALEQQFAVEVWLDQGAADFTFFNLDPAALFPDPPVETIPSFIAQIYWELTVPTLLDFGSGPEWPGVVLPAGWVAARPQGNPPGNLFDAAFNAAAAKPAPRHGISPGEHATISIDLAEDSDAVPDPGSALLDALLGGNLRLAMHVQGINEEYSDMFVTGDWWHAIDERVSPEAPLLPPRVALPSPVPLPATGGLGFLGLILVGLLQGYRRIRH